MRRSLADTWFYLKNLGYSRDLHWHEDGSPKIPDRMPSIYDEQDQWLCLRFFRSGTEDLDLSNLTLPRLFFCRSYLTRTNYSGTDLTESFMCWNDFEDCNFDGADLSRCDMRASIYRRCTFRNATFHKTDLRRAFFEDCDFTDADFTGAKSETGIELRDYLSDFLTEEQCESIIWTDDEGPEPEGG